MRRQTWLYHAFGLWWFEHWNGFLRILSSLTVCVSYIYFCNASYVYCDVSNILQHFDRHFLWPCIELKGAVKSASCRQMWYSIAVLLSIYLNSLIKLTTVCNAKRIEMISEGGCNAPTRTTFCYLNFELSKYFSGIRCWKWGTFVLGSVCRRIIGLVAWKLSYWSSIVSVPFELYIYFRFHLVYCTA